MINLKNAIFTRKNRIKKQAKIGFRYNTEMVDKP